MTSGAGSTSAREAAGRIVYSVAEASVTQEDHRSVTLLRFAGTCSQDLIDWLPRALKEVRTSAALNLRELGALDLMFVQGLLDAARDAVRRKRQVALVDPPPFVTEVLEQSGLTDRFPLLSCESALLEGASVPDAILREQAALADIGSRFEVNPLWRKTDQESVWLCPVCGVEVEDVRVASVLRPSLAVLRGVRRHLLEGCAAWRGGRRVPLPAMILDAYLADVNKRKALLDTERRQKLSREMESLQEKVDTMADLEQSLDAAKRKQLHMLPIDPPPDAIADIAVVYRPLQSVSGDFLDFYSLGDNRFGVAVGDVSGHGIETAVIMGMAKMAFRIRSQSLGTVAEMMTDANSDLFSELRRAAFVTGFFALIDRTTLRMSYVRAGHTPSLLRRADGRLEELAGAGLPFGVDDGRRFGSALEPREADLAPDDVLLIYTDGVTEAGAAPNQFGEEGLRQAFTAAPAGANPRAILDGVTAALDQFLAGQPLSDDVTMVCLKIRRAPVPDGA